MPNPKDAIKLQEFREKMSKIAKEQEYGKWMKGRVVSEETKEKMSKSQLALITPENRQERSKRAKELGYGKWMKGRKLPKDVVEKMAASKRGKTYEEIYGNRAEEQKQIRREGNRSSWENSPDRKPPDSFLSSGSARKGKTYKEIYGEERAKEESKKRSDAHRARAKKPRESARVKHNADYRYAEWRTAVFERDGFKCQECHKTGRVEAHHIKGWAKYPLLRYDIDNGTTLCAPCHKDRHKKK